MSRTERFHPLVVSQVPDALEDGLLYVSLEYATAIHLCACGCRREVVTPLRPGKWRLIYDGKVTLSPSIGNWSLPCRSHYCIVRNRVVWARSWSDDEVAAARQRLDAINASPSGRNRDVRSVIRTRATRR